MADEDQTPQGLTEEEMNKQFAAIQREIAGLVSDLSNEQIAQLEDVYYLWICWGDFHLAVTEPYIEEKLPPTVIAPHYDAKTKSYEHVYNIYDYGNRFSTSPGEELMTGSRATGKLLNTVEKIIKLAAARAKEKSGGEATPDIRVAFLGLDIAQRRAYKVCLDAPENILVMNFDPGEWGERFFKTSKALLEKGYLSGPKLK